MTNGESYVFRREVKDNSGLMDWIAAEGEVVIHVYSSYDAGAIEEIDEQVCLESGTIEKVEMHINNDESASGEGDFVYCWLLYRGGAEEELLDTLWVNDTRLDTTITLKDYGLSVPVTLYVKRIVQNSRCLTEWQESANIAKWRLGRAEKATTPVTVCMADMPYQGTYNLTDGGSVSYTFTEAGQNVVIEDKTEEGCPLSVTLVCQVTTVPIVEVKPVISLCESAASMEIGYRIQEGLPDRYDLVFSEKAEDLGFVSIYGGELPTGKVIEVPVPAGIPVTTVDFAILFYASTASDNECRGISHQIQVSVDMDGYVFRKGDDVLFIDNSGKHTDEGLTFTSYQWYKNDEPIEGATGQFYYENIGLNGYYQVEMTTTDGTVYHSCIYEMRTGQGLEEVPQNFASPEGKTEIYSLDGRRCADIEQKGIYILRWYDENKQIHTRKLLIQ
jgi:hypothetical protein